MTVTADLIYKAAQDLLRAADATLVAAGYDSPANQFVSWMAPSWDCCDLLTVHFTNLGPHPSTTRSQQRGGNVISASAAQVDLILSLVGCAAIGDPIPSNDAIDANAQEMYGKAWTIYQMLLCGWPMPQFLDELPTCKMIKVGNLQPRQPIGGCESFTVTVTIELT